MKGLIIVVGLALLVACVTGSRSPIANQLGTLRLPYTVTPDGTVMLERDTQGLALSAVVRRQFQTLFAYSVRAQLEDAACITRFAIDTGFHPPHVDVYAITNAVFDSSDMLHIWARRFICDSDAPSAHTHVWRDQIVDEPSEPDQRTASRALAPFHLILFRAGNDHLMGITLYWPAGREPQGEKHSEQQGVTP